MNIDYARAYVAALTGNPETAMNWRCIHDTNKGLPAHLYTGSISTMFQTLAEYNAAGWGIFANVNEMDGRGNQLENVKSIRAQFADVDGNPQGAAAAMAGQPSFMVNSSEGKQHFYWCVNPFHDLQAFEFVQRRYVTAYAADPACIDPTRVLRVPGFYNRKYATPYLVTPYGVSNVRYDVSQLAASVAHIMPSGGGGIGGRKELGTPSLAAPDLQWLRYAFSKINPNELDRSEWISLTAAFKQAGWSLTDENTLFGMWASWCAQYQRNDTSENLKQWNSIRSTERGWSGIVSRAGIMPELLLGQAGKGVIVANGARADTTSNVTSLTGGASEFMDALQQSAYFQGCVLIQSEGRIRTPHGVYMDATKFNASYGGPRFVITPDGKVTDEPWKAVTRNALWKLPSVHATRFMPALDPGAIAQDEFGRYYVNSYIPPKIDAVEGDITPFLNHLANLIPDARDREIILDYMTHAVQRRGVKIPWCPVIQSGEGAGKQAFKIVMEHALGGEYVYIPNAQQLADSGGKFNGWMENKLFIVCDEIRVGEKYHLMEVLKPLVSDLQIEIERKGVDQKKGDNIANWMMFTNYKDAIIVNDSSRRYAIFFSNLQTVEQIAAVGMGEQYFMQFYDWLNRGGGKQAVTYWLQRRPLSEHFQFARAPKTSSTVEAVDISKSALQQMIESATAADEVGFRKGWVSTVAATRLAVEAGLRLEAKSLAKVLQSMGYFRVGQLWKGVDRGTILWHKNPGVITTFDYEVHQFLKG